MALMHPIGRYALPTWKFQDIIDNYCDPAIIQTNYLSEGLTGIRVWSWTNRKSAEYLYVKQGWFEELENVEAVE